MDEHSVPTLAMDEFDWILSRTSGGEPSLQPNSTTSAPQTSAHAPLFVNPLKVWLYPVPPLPTYVCPSFVAQTDMRALSWHKLVTHLGM